MDERSKSKSTRKSTGIRSRKGIKANMEIPINLERVLIEAAKDSAFFEKLMTNREHAVLERGFDLRPSELAMLSAMPESLFEKLIEGFRPAKLAKSRFARRVVAAMAGSMMLASAGCADSEDRFDGADAGIGPDAEDRFVGADTGMDPELPKDAGYDSRFVSLEPDVGSAIDGGVRPDVPLDAMDDSKPDRLEFDASADADDDSGSENP